VTEIAPGWYKDPVDPTTQRYWDGAGWVGAPIAADATPPPGPPPAERATARPTPVLVAPPGALPRLPQPGAVASDWPYRYGQPVAVAAPRPHGLALAGLGARFVARLVDMLAVLVLCVAANAWFAIEFWRGFGPFYAEVMRRSLAGSTNTEGLQPPESASTLLLLMCVATTAVWFAYEVPASANSGQTLGKRLLGIKVVRLESDERLGFRRSLRRWGRLGLPTLLWYCCGIGFLLQLFDCLFATIDRPLRQALHDKAAATVVVQVPRPARHTAPGGTHADPS
jgi:uncharacterized RDD family membrane protein YckC